MDTFAWIEYLDGSPRGIRVRQIIDDAHNTIITSPVSIAEIVSKYHRKNRDVSRALVEIDNASSIPLVDATTARLAGEIHAEQRKTQKDFPFGRRFRRGNSKDETFQDCDGRPTLRKPS